ncbi:MAG: hypothetical protein KGL59_02095 [Acidobacteriota bacterium]|nr:hypothetical protein [Acidobacteriota bacterium]
MMKSLLALGLAAVLTAAVAAQASTLKLKDGRQFQGTYLGGTEQQVQFLINGQVRVFNTSQVYEIDFATPAQASDAAQPPAPATPPPASAYDQPQDQSQAQSSYQGNDQGLTQSVTVPQGTTIMIRMIDNLDSSVNRPGDIFHASLADDLKIGDVIVAKKDADVYGKLIQVKSAGRATGKSELSLELTGIRTANGSIQPIVSGDYEAAGKSRTKQTVEHSVIGAAIGAVIGGVAGGGGGAAKGAGIGGAVGAGATLITHGQQIKIPSETLLNFQLAQPFMVTVPKASE